MKKTLAYRILQVVSLLPILAWPLVFYVSAFLFDDPNGNASLLFFAINAYPLYLIANLILSKKLYENERSISVLLLIWPILVVVLVVLFLS
ncbi:hypothetical protein DF185_08310 [Marinifilum breve]|uniref:Uncharacterized protein n=1 Tax=Marinifilum breve TaxID=2184082 RepID=A0A2V4A0V7_9BACT|nr:hypothetical protein [Marinifilum breve]PXY01477.1 hypothetical protein DF185_08310 [Marinifilum breve]